MWYNSCHKTNYNFRPICGCGCGGFNGCGCNNNNFCPPPPPPCNQPCESNPCCPSFNFPVMPLQNCANCGNYLNVFLIGYIVGSLKDC